MRVQMRMSFNDEESFKDAVESLHFNNSSSDPNAQHQMGSSNSTPLQESERNEARDNIITSDPIITLQVRRVGSSSSLSILEIRRSGDIQVCFNNPQSNPEFTATMPP